MLVQLLPFYFFSAAIIGLVVSVILLSTKKYFSRRLFLSISLFSISICAFNDFCNLTGYIAELPYLYILSRAFMFLVAPCSYLYIRNTLTPKYPFRRNDWLHFVPFMLFIIVSTNICLVNPGSYMKLIEGIKSNDVSGFKIIANLYALNMVLWLLYVALQIKAILKSEQQKSIADRGHDPKVIDWIKFLNLLLVLVFFLSMINKMHFDSNAESNLIEGFVLSFMLLVAAFYLLSNPEILYNIKPVQAIAIPVPYLNDKPDIESSSAPTPLFRDKQKEEYILVLESVLNQHKPYLRKGFSLKDLSELTTIPSHHLSFLVNNVFNMPFQDFINFKRIEYMKANLGNADWEKLSLEGIAWEVGFSSRTTFFRSFVKLTGVSPSEYMNSLDARTKNASA